MCALYTNLLLAEFILTVCKQTADTLNQGHYKDFDAWLKISVCQGTALEVHQLVEKSSLHDEAVEISEIVAGHFEKIGQIVSRMESKKKPVKYQISALS